MSSPSDTFLVPLRGLNEFVYCPRLYHLMYVQGLFDESVETLEGKAAHDKKLARGKAIKTDEEEEALPWSDYLVRQLTLSDHDLKITGKFDVVMNFGNEVIPVEVKHGPAPDGEGEFFVDSNPLEAIAWNNDQVQLAAQIQLLRTAGYRCIRGKIYYRGTKTSVTINWSENLSAALSHAAESARKLATETMPSPLKDSRKCIRCSLNHICLPDETLHLQNKCKEPRQLYPGRDDTGILHITTPGTHVGKSGETLKISLRDKKKDEVIQLKEVAHVCLWGNVQMSTQALLEAVDRGITVAHLTGGGWLRAVTTPPQTKNVHLRREQYRHCDDQASALAVSRWIVSAKITNQRTLLRRNGADDSSLEELARIRGKCGSVISDESLRGYEGRAGKIYWEQFPRLLKQRDGKQFKMNGRNRRPPKDPVNALLSLGYSLLLRDCLVALHSCGMDPYYGLFHALTPGRPALALDLMEPFRSLIVDSAVLRSLNEGTFSENDFVTTAGACLLKPAARKKWITAYERRIDELVTHPLFGYRLSYRRLLMMESRLLGRYFVGEMAEYHPLTTR